MEALEFRTNTWPPDQLQNAMHSSQQGASADGASTVPDMSLDFSVDENGSRMLDSNDQGKSTMSDHANVSFDNNDGIDRGKDDDQLGGGDVTEDMHEGGDGMDGQGMDGQGMEGQGMEGQGMEGQGMEGQGMGDGGWGTSQASSVEHIPTASQMAPMAPLALKGSNEGRMLAGKNVPLRAILRNLIGKHPTYMSNRRHYLGDAKDLSKATVARLQTIAHQLNIDIGAAVAKGLDLSSSETISSSAASQHMTLCGLIKQSPGFRANANKYVRDGRLSELPQAVLLQIAREVGVYSEAAVAAHFKRPVADLPWSPSDDLALLLYVGKVGVVNFWRLTSHPKDVLRGRTNGALRYRCFVLCLGGDSEQTAQLCLPAPPLSSQDPLQHQHQHQHDQHQHQHHQPSSMDPSAAPPQVEEQPPPDALLDQHHTSPPQLAPPQLAPPSQPLPPSSSSSSDMLPPEGDTGLGMGFMPWPTEEDDILVQFAVDHSMDSPSTIFLWKLARALKILGDRTADTMWMRYSAVTKELYGGVFGPKFTPSEDRALLKYADDNHLSKLGTLTFWDKAVINQVCPPRTAICLRNRYCKLRVGPQQRRASSPTKTPSKRRASSPYDEGRAKDARLSLSVGTSPASMSASIQTNGPLAAELLVHPYGQPMLHPDVDPSVPYARTYNEHPVLDHQDGGMDMNAQ